MTTHSDINLHDLEPGEYNPLEHEPTYNPLRHCYLMVATVDDIEYELAVKFQLQMHGETTPIDFIDPKTSKPHSVNFFPKLPEIALEPEPDRDEPNLDGLYQIGEAPYYLVPTVHRCKHIQSGRLLTREAAIHLISPEILQEAIARYLNKIGDDPNAPEILSELLAMWDPSQAYRFNEIDDDWDKDLEDKNLNEEDHYEI